MERKGSITRNTNETQITIDLCLDGSGEFSGTTGIGFFNHMLELMAKHGLLNLLCTCKGDLHVDGHHTVEDIGICLGKAITQAIGDKKSIKRYSTVFLPMDESMTMVAIDISGRPYLHFEADFPSPMIGSFDTQLIEEFFRGLVTYSGITLHIRMLYGKNSHHMAEAIFKAFGRALDEAAGFDIRVKGVPSTKGML